MSATDIISLVKDTGLGGMSLALFFRLGKVVADHEIRIGALEGKKARRQARKRGAR